MAMDKEKLGLGEPPELGGTKHATDEIHGGLGGAAGPATSDPTRADASLPHGAEPANHPDAMPSLPVAEPFQGFTSSLPKESKGVFNQLVGGDGDISGLVAYSIYKQNKLDWLSAFQTAKGRDPTDEEMAAYIIGEGTPRRIATYRHLAEATLAGSGPTLERAGDGPGLRVAPRRISAGLGDNPGLIATYAVIALLFLIGVLIAGHYAMSSR